MNKKQWKAEYSKWRAFLSFIPHWINKNDRAYSEAHSIKFEAFCDGAHQSIYYAITDNREMGNYTSVDSRSAIWLNLVMSKEACERKRIKDRTSN